MSSSVVSRLSIPAFVSLMGLVLTQAWYQKSALKTPKIGNSGPPIAVLDFKNDKIERRPTTRIIWENLGQGENLYSGEAVRTSSTASGKITFLQSGMSIGLEPDSLVIIEEMNGKTQLNLINGGVFVKNEGTAGANSSNKSKIDQPILKAGNQKIELSNAKNAEMNLSVSESGNANIQVTKGEIKIADSTGKSVTVEEGKSKAITTTNTAPAILDVIGPKSGAIIPLLKVGDRMSLGWTNAPDGSSVFLESGITRDGLKRAGSGTLSAQKKFDTEIPAGDFFWRLVAVKDGKVVAIGPTNFNKGLVLEAPKLLQNASNQKIAVKQDKSNPVINLAWSRPQGSEDVTVFVATDKEFKNVVATKTFATETEWTVEVKNSGNYFWRTAVKWPGLANRTVSDIGTFELIQQKELPVPILSAPLTKSVFSKPVTDESGVLLTWQPIQGATGYELSLEQGTEGNFKNVLTKSVSSTQFRLTNLAAGQYRWSVKTIQSDLKSKQSNFNTFQIAPMARIGFVPANIDQSPIVIQALTESVSIALGPVPPESQKIRFRVAGEADKLKDAPWQEAAPQKPIQFKVNAEGNYKLNVEALDAKGKTIGVSQETSITVKTPEKLPAPQFATANLEFKTGESGDIELKWLPVVGAQKYFLEITGPKTNFKKDLSTTSLKLNSLYPGTHSLKVTAIDKAGRMGMTNSSAKIVVPDVSNIAAPTSKGIKIR